MSKRRIVVTGMGMVSPLGNTVDETWENILKGESGVATIETFDVSGLGTQFAASVKNLDVSEYYSAKDAKRQDLFIQYGMVAGIQAIKDAGLEITEEQADRVGVAIGSGIGGLPNIEKNRDLYRDKGAKRISPFFIPGSIVNMIAGNLSILYGYRGPNISIATACTTGTHNIGMAARMIAYGDADVMIAGGAEMATSELGVAGFGAARALSTRNDDPQAASRPWDRDRDGFVLGDGAGAIVLEEYEFAKARGANILAELTGFGMSADAFHMTSPPENGRGAAAAMKAAIADAGINPDQMDYINAHGTSTPAGDIAESQAAESVFGDHAKKLVMSSTKSSIGHLLGAAGAVEAIFCIKALIDQVAPPTINLENPDEGCHLDYVANTARNLKLDTVISNSFGFGGTNGSVIFSKLR
ncbi:MAG: beta-ketoacyl-ACP synthase II [Pseudomonadales bacterium]|nr:beta-ketoacyl-ACP synthase II [Pseudomonadales bacterium]